MKTTTKIGVVGVPDHKHLLITTPRVSMFLTREDPAGTASLLPQALKEGETVLLGDKLYLVIASIKQDKSGVFYLPDQCEASSDPPLNLTIPIWDRLETERQCIKEPTLMDMFSVFPSGLTYVGNTYNLAFAPVYTFLFDQLYVHNNNVTYTCSFLVCPSSYSTPGTVGRCEQRLSNDSVCFIFPPPSNNRLRRNALSHRGSEDREILSVTVQVQQVDSLQIAGTTRDITAVILVAVFVPFTVIVILIIICLMYCEARKRKRKQQKVKRHFEMSVRRQL